MFRRKEQYLAEYRSICFYLNEHLEDVQTVEGLIEMHKNYALDEKVMKMNGILHAIYHFYLKDYADYVRRMKVANTELEQKYIQERLMADEMLLEELNEKLPIYDTVHYKKERKKYLEVTQKVTLEEIQEIEAELNASKLNL